MHLKRQEVPKSWAIPRKGSAYVVRPSSKLYSGIPLLIALRDLLKLTKNRRETKKAIIEKFVLLNGKPVKDERTALVLFDVITIVPSKANYRLTLSDKGKFFFEEIKKDFDKKIAKIINKKILKGKRAQFNLSDGRNVLTQDSHKIGDSVILNLKENKIERSLPLKEKSNVIVCGGKHIGAKGEITKVDEKQKIVEIQTEEKTKMNILIKHLMIIE